MPEQLDLESIRLRAYELWETSGRPEGVELQFWLQAECDLTEEYRKEDVKETPPDLPGRGI